MVQSQSRMVDEIESLNRQARDYFVFKLLQGEIKVADADDFLEKYGYPIDWEQWCILAIQIDSLDDTGYTTNDHDWLMYAIQNMVEELVPSTNRLSPIVQNKCLLLFCGAPMDEMRSLKVQVFQYAESIQQNVRHYLKLKISVGISRAYWGFAHTSLAYQESLEALTYRVRLGPESILFIDEAQPERQDHLRYPKELEFNIIEAVRQLEHDRAKANLEQIIACFFEKHVNHNDYQILLGRLFNNLIGIVQDAGASVRDVFQSDIFQSDIMLSMHSPQDIRKWFEQEILDPLLRWMEVQHRKHDINISQEIINAIHQEYDKDLSIELFASRLNYHPSYISRVFKKDTGITFTDYLTQYRIELSKKWLKDTNMKISDIAEKLRYSAAPSFNRSFKKSVKITPSQYREQFNKQLGDD
jgi:two-component system response regulator YesN